jgi:hypothetical protein
VGSALGSRNRRRWLDCGDVRRRDSLVSRFRRQPDRGCRSSGDVGEHLRRDGRRPPSCPVGAGAGRRHRSPGTHPRAVDRLSAAGLDATFPYWWLDARGASAGVGMWSRHPIQAPSRIDGYTMAFISAPSTDHRYLDESHRRRRPHPRSLAIPDRRLATRPGTTSPEELGEAHIRFITGSPARAPGGRARKETTTTDPSSFGPIDHWGRSAHPERRCIAHRKNGDRCKNAAGRGTNVCDFHGAKGRR